MAAIAGGAAGVIIIIGLALLYVWFKRKRDPGVTIKNMVVSSSFELGESFYSNPLSTDTYALASEETKYQEVSEPNTQDAARYRENGVTEDMYKAHQYEYVSPSNLATANRTSIAAGEGKDTSKSLYIQVYDEEVMKSKASDAAHQYYLVDEALYVHPEDALSFSAPSGAPQTTTLT
eukprot:Colp12_sorted_trinity150504_noHs@11493